MGKKTTLDKEYKGLPINTNLEKKQACILPILDRYNAHLEDMTIKHSKVMQVRFDLRYPTDESVMQDKQHLHNFNYNLQRKLQREKHAGGHKVDPRLIMVTEQHHSKHPHMHCVLLINGNAKQNYYSVVQQVEKTWKQVLGTDAKGLVDRCDRKDNGIMMNRNNEDFMAKKDQCSYQASYLSKEKGKENKEKGSWSVTGTRVYKK